MTRETFLREKLEMASHNLMCYSKNYAMDTPKEGYEERYREAGAEVEMLKVWLKEFHNTRTDSTREFIGYISSTGYGKAYDGKRLATMLGFEVDTGVPYPFIYGDRRTFGIGPDVQSWFVGENGGCGSYDIEKDRRDSRLVRITVDVSDYVLSIEWVEEE